MLTETLAVLETRAPSQVVVLTERVTEALPLVATLLNSCVFLEVHLWNAFVDVF